MLLATYSLKSTVNFPMRTINGLSDHDAELLKLENTVAPIQEFASYCVRNINSSIIYKFQCKLSAEGWQDVFEGSETNVIFNNFLNIYLKTCNACLTKSKHNSAYRDNRWTTGGIKISCQNKRILYMRCRGSNDTNHKLRYKRYCKISTDIIKTAKKM